MTLAVGYEESSRSLTTHSTALGAEYCGRKFRVYVTQVLTDGRESALSEPAVITIGDTICPPTPTGLKVLTQTLTGASIAVSVCWDIPPDTVEWGDLDHYVVYQWLNFSHLSDFSPDITIYESMVMSKTIASTADSSTVVNKDLNTFTIAGTLISHNFYIGVQAVDSSGNKSDINVLHLTSEYNASPALPSTYAILAEARPLSLELKVSSLPADTNLAAIVAYRDNEVEAGRVTYPTGGGTVRIREEAIDFAPHYYTFSVINTAGHESFRSIRSNSVSARRVSTSDINEEELTAAFEANASGINTNLVAVRQNLTTQSQNIATLASSLEGVHNEVAITADTVSLLVNEFNSLSAEVSRIGGVLSTMGTQITQNSREIALRATYNSLDEATAEVTENLTAQIKVQANTISSIVTELNRTDCSYSAITQLKDQISLKVNKNGVISAINLSPEEITISGNKLHVTADTTFDRNVTIKGNLEAANITIKNPDGSIAFGGPNIKCIPNMGFLSTGDSPINIPGPASYSGDIFDNLPWNTLYSTNLSADGLTDKFATLCGFILFDKRDNGVTAQARIYAKYGSTIYYGTTTEVSFSDFQETGVSIAQIPSLPAGRWEIGIQARRSSSTDGGIVRLKSAQCQFFITGVV